ncbi:hypothetical protein K493DRAFT_306589 [Basidiobolus meristosporus CBS 931.73]|uniref:Sequence orphan n=1 Tax=Basidiobolus meristosporus CBS 931.73 TaxID=1314790 RepID=A0A1Y1XRV0_9FUNG|nr:hypothetical protein K493DRAFT_306589 [Basidiobolus meristosporus CBS 931.73]|eukprot:ORX88480.1 hypothetical protein K493DRAFT_306589 [Basidiobolus meristosporus CBS 931.73]
MPLILLLLWFGVSMFNGLFARGIDHLDNPLVCYDHPRPWQKTYKIRVECEMEDVGKLKGARVMSPGEPALKLQLQCNAEPERCDKVRATFDTAFRLITNVVVFREPLVVNASFVSFCQEFNECNRDFRILGSAGPSRTIVLVDDDGRKRAFPQALLKQKGYAKHPKFSPSDIMASFNSDVDFWFQDEGAMQKSQSDFLFVIIHELVHGLGVSSSWMDYLQDTTKALTPNILVAATAELYIFGGFVENMFDKYIVEYPSLKPLTDMVDQLDEFAGGPGSIFSSVEEFNQTFHNSPQYIHAARMVNLTTTPHTLAFVPRNASMNEPIILETSLNPFIPGSSISHFDFASFSDSPDFLMRFMEDRGVSIDENVGRGGHYIGGAIGPQLISILETLGYEINPAPRPLSDFISKVESGADGQRRLCGTLWIISTIVLYFLCTYLLV